MLLGGLGTSIFLAAPAPAHRLEGAEQDADKQDPEQPPQHVHAKEMIAIVHIEHEKSPCQLDWKAKLCRSAWLHDARDLTVRRCADAHTRNSSKWAQIAERHQLDFTVVNAALDTQFAFMTADDHRVVAAFEVEHSTSIYLGIVRMLDLALGTGIGVADLAPHGRSKLFVFLFVTEQSCWIDRYKLRH